MNQHLQAALLNLGLDMPVQRLAGLGVLVGEGWRQKRQKGISPGAVKMAVLELETCTQPLQGQDLLPKRQRVHGNHLRAPARLVFHEKPVVPLHGGIGLPDGLVKGRITVWRDERRKVVQRKVQGLQRHAALYLVQDIGSGAVLLEEPLHERIHLVRRGRRELEEDFILDFQ